MRLHQITRGRPVAEVAPSHPGNPNVTRARKGDEQAKAKAATSAERDAELERQKRAETGPTAGQTAADKDLQNRKMILQRLGNVTDWSPRNAALGKLLTQLLEPGKLTPPADGK